MIYLVSYDIQDDKRRNKIMNLLKNYGARVQYSVFECILLDEKLKKLKEEIYKIVDLETDSVRVYSIPDNFKKKILIIRVGKVINDEKFYII